MEGSVTGCNWLGVAFVSSCVPNCEALEEEIADKCEELRGLAQDALDEWLEARGLEQVMGVIFPIGKIK